MLTSLVTFFLAHSLAVPAIPPQALSVSSFSLYLPVDTLLDAFQVLPIPIGLPPWSDSPSEEGKDAP